MLRNISNLSSGVKNFIVNHKLLCVLTLGLAIAGIIFRGRIYSWIQQARNTTERADTTGQNTLRNNEANHNAIESPRVGFKLNVLDLSNAAIRDMILNDQTVLPQPVDDFVIIGEIYTWTPDYMADVLNKRTSVPPRFLQAAQYIDAQNRCQETREHEIIPHVYVGNYDALRAIDPQQGNNPVGFTRVISVTKQSPTGPDEFYQAAIPATVARVSVEVNDDDSAWKALVDNFETFFKMIDEARANKENILIHCSQGQSRSVTVMMAYLINRFNVTPEQALHYIRTKRFIAEPVPGLYHRLEQYASSVQTSMTSEVATVRDATLKDSSPKISYNVNASADIQDWAHNFSSPTRVIASPHYSGYGKVISYDKL